MRASSVRSHHSSAVSPGVKRPRSTTPSASSAQQRRVRVSRRDAERRGERRGGDGPGQRDPAAQRSRRSRRSRVQVVASRDAGGRSAGIDREVGMDRAQLRQPLDGHDDAARVRLSRRRTRPSPARRAAISSAQRAPAARRPARRRSRNPAVSSASCSSSASRGSGRSSSRTRAIAVGVERAEVAGRRGIGRPPRLHGMAAPLLERRVVEEGVGLAR